MGNPVETWLDALSPENRTLIDRLRDLVTAAAPDLTETIKWNAPSFADGDQDRVTLGIERKGGARLVLHRGAAVRAPSGFAVEDPERLAKWPSSDRGVATFADLSAVEAKAADLEDLIHRWIAANRQA
ncbi:DUF1801 domain-containing protein [Brevundimonas sp. FT23028]|uniref:DUF1801 domain-containing protein n=1 Tax=Brevundimonas sp. FT23028 TaxID=3393748 RepID=UPI003B585EE0